MATSFAKKFFFGAVASAVLIALVAALLLSWDGGSEPAQAAHEPGPPPGITNQTAGDDYGIDMVIAGNGPATLGAIDACASVVGDGNTSTVDVTFDAFYDGIPAIAGTNMAGEQHIISPKPGHSLAGLTVLTYSDVAAGGQHPP